MWTTFFTTFTLALMVAGFGLLLFARRPFAVSALIALMIALASSAADLVFGYFPKLHDGWKRVHAKGPGMDNRFRRLKYRFT
jgi:hypothetical protein